MMALGVVNTKVPHLWLYVRYITLDRLYFAHICEYSVNLNVPIDLKRVGDDEDEKNMGYNTETFIAYDVFMEITLWSFIVAKCKIH